MKVDIIKEFKSYLETIEATYNIYIDIHKKILNRITL